MSEAWGVKRGAWGVERWHPDGITPHFSLLIPHKEELLYS